MITHLWLENLTFLAIATAFLVIVGWAWRRTKPFTLPHPLPGWFKIWFASVQIGGGLLPLLALIWWGGWQGYSLVSLILIPYLLMLGLQILSEIMTLRWQTVVWVMVPYLYLPYRFWQLYEGWQWLAPIPELAGVRYLLLGNLILWIANYCLDLAQLPRLLRWEPNSP
ncbi:MAG: hypothetical protein HC890_07110 [Chloroflexaceae bacterium]|nr:hypothetical protein [Chloroflexaceae bacterium]